jgi:hypothetical protein
MHHKQGVDDWGNFENNENAEGQKRTGKIFVDE